MKRKIIIEALTYIVATFAAMLITFFLCRPADRAIEKYGQELKQEIRETSIYTEKGGYFETY